MPGVLMVEAMAQAGGVHDAARDGRTGSDKLIYFTGIDNCRFRRPVVPGDQLLLEVDLLSRRRTSPSSAGRAPWTATLACEAEFISAMVERPMSREIHPTAVVDPRARDRRRRRDRSLHGRRGRASGSETGRRIGPFCRLTGLTTIGRRNRFESHCSIGAPPQDISYAGEPTRLEIGDDNVFREFVTIHRGTPKGGGVTRIGRRSLFMAYAHVAHDCQVGSRTIFANDGTLAGHVEVGDFATIGAFSAVHQFCRVGRHAFLGGVTIATKDCLPFMKTVGGRPARCFGPNSIGLERKGLSAESREALKRLWRLLHHPKLNTTAAVDRARGELGDQPEVGHVLEFIDSSTRGVILSRG